MIVSILFAQTGQIRTAFIYLVGIDNWSYQYLLSPTFVVRAIWQTAVLVIPIMMLLFCINIKEGIEAVCGVGALRLSNEL